MGRNPALLRFQLYSSEKLYSNAILAISVRKIDPSTAYTHDGRINVIQSGVIHVDIGNNVLIDADGFFP